MLDNRYLSEMITRAPLSGSPNFEFDLSLIVISYNRVNGLLRLIERLQRQQYSGSWQIILWNNNKEFAPSIDTIVNTVYKSIPIEVIHSSSNYHCVVRMAAATLARGRLIMFCDDDIIPESTYLETFTTRFAELERLGEVAICGRGHHFSLASFPQSTARSVWEERKGVARFDPKDPEMPIHYMHASSLLLTRNLMLRVSALPYPEERYKLVDDYWMSFVLSHLFRVRTIKIEAANAYTFSESSDDPRIAMYRRRDVHEAKLAFFDYHMQRGWPQSA